MLSSKWKVHERHTDHNTGKSWNGNCWSGNVWEALEIHSKSGKGTLKEVSFQGIAPIEKGHWLALSNKPLRASPHLPQ